MHASEASRYRIRHTKIAVLSLLLYTASLPRFFHRGIIPLLTSVLAAVALKTSCHPLRRKRFMPFGKPPDNDFNILPISKTSLAEVFLLVSLVRENAPRSIPDTPRTRVIAKCDWLVEECMRTKRVIRGFAAGGGKVF